MSQHGLWASYSGTARITLAVILLAVAAAVAFSGTRLRRPARLPHPGRITTTGPIAPVTFTAVGVTFVVIVLLGRSFDGPVRLAGAAIGALAAPMIFEFPFDFIVMTRVTQASAAHLVLYFVPLFLIEIITLSLLAASPMVYLLRDRTHPVPAGSWPRPAG